MLTYMYWFSVLAGSMSTDQQEKRERRQTGPRVGRIMIQRLPGTYICVLVQRSSGFREYRPAREREKIDRD